MAIHISLGLLLALRHGGLNFCRNGLCRLKGLFAEDQSIGGLGDKCENTLTHI